MNRGQRLLAASGMMSALAFASTFACTFTSTGANAAVSITNRDDKEHKLTVIEDEGKTKADHTLKGGGQLDGVCKAGCIVRLNDSEEDEYELEGTETVSIEEGFLYYEGGDAPAETAPGGTGTAPAAPAPAAPQKK